MIPGGLFTHLFLILTAVAVAVTFIQPTLVEIGENQDKILLYQGEIAKVSDVNAKLAALVNTYNTVSLTDQTRLRTYIPDRVDSVAVPRDIYAIAIEAGVIVNSITLNDTPGNTTQDIDMGVSSFSVPPPLLHKFTVSLQGSYSQIKRFLELIEQNVYPLEVQNLNIQKSEGGYLSVEISLGTYSRIAREENTMN